MRAVEDRRMRWLRRMKCDVKCTIYKRYKRLMLQHEATQACCVLSRTEIMLMLR